MPKNTDWEKMALRRAKFVIEEARCDQPVYDQTVTAALRVISNWATVGRNGSSAAIKWLNPRLSEAAWELYHSVTDAEWQQGTINEHPEPISQVWLWILREKESIDPQAVLHRMQQWPMITVTRQEDAAISQSGNRAQGDPEARHARIKLRHDGPPQKRKTT